MQVTSSKGHDFLESIAASIFSRHGIDFASTQPGGGWTNLAWIADQLVLRLSAQKERDNLLREARLSAFLPPEVGYPQIVEYGTTAGYAWVLSKKATGCRLGKAWDNFDGSGKVAALQGLWQRAQAVHSVSCADIAASVPRETWFNSADSKEAEANLGRRTKAGIFTKAEAGVLRKALTHFFRALPNASCVLCHGDLSLDNAIWHDGEVTALLDFEFAVLAPIQLDLNNLLRHAYGPGDTSPGEHVVQHLRLALRDIALPLLAQSGEKVLLLGYAILLELHLLEEWLEHSEGEGPLEQWRPLRRLHSLADGQGGYLRPLVHP